MNAAAGVRHGECFRLAVSSSLDFMHHLAEIEFGDDECFYLRRELANLFLWERPCRDQSQFPDSQAFSRADSMARCATREVIP